MLKKNFVPNIRMFSVEEDGLVDSLKKYLEPEMAYVGFLNRHTGHFYLVKDAKNKAYFNISTPEALELREQNIKKAIEAKEKVTDLLTFHTLCDPEKNHYLFGLTRAEYDNLDRMCQRQLIHIYTAFQLLAGQWVKTNVGWTDKYIPMKVAMEKPQISPRS